MVNFSPKIEDATDNQLKHWISESSPQYAQIASNELIKRSISRLEETIKKFNKQSSEQTQKMIWLTWTIVVLTIVMVVGLVIQIILAL